MPEVTQSNVDDDRRLWHSAYLSARIKNGGDPYPPTYESYPAGAERGARAVIATLTELGVIHRTGVNGYTIYTPAGLVNMTAAELHINTQED